MKRGWMAAVMVVAIHTHAAPQPPATATIAERVVRVVLPDHVLQRPEVRRQLSSALTTTFLIVARSPQMTDDRARLEVRFDLWDDAYVVRRTVRGRAEEERRIASLTELAQWWRTPISIGIANAATVTIDLQLTVLPFSAADEGDARDWLSKSGGVGTEQSSVDGVVGAMIGTTIQARPIAKYRWTIQAAERR